MCARNVRVYILQTSATAKCVSNSVCHHWPGLTPVQFCFAPVAAWPLRAKLIHARARERTKCVYCAHTLHDTDTRGQDASKRVQRLRFRFCSYRNASSANQPSSWDDENFSPSRPSANIYIVFLIPLVRACVCVERRGWKTTFLVSSQSKCVTSIFYPFCPYVATAPLYETETNYMRTYPFLSGFLLVAVAARPRYRQI